MAKKRQGRDIGGILILNKPLGASSNEVLQQVKRIYAAAKAGHTGALDPLATGVLPICFGEATKFSQYLLDSDKRYRVEAYLGERRSTGDAEGDVLESRPHDAVTMEQIHSVVNKFVGEVDQIPPMHSAIKHKGKPLYKLAREGKEVERKVRRITIYQLDVLGFDGQTITMDVRCSKGTYIRTLVEDIGEVLGCGAYVSALHRTQAGPFTDAQSVVPDDVWETKQGKGFEGIDELLHEMGDAFVGWPKVELSATASYYVLQGQKVQVSGIPADTRWVCLYDAPDEGTTRFLGVAEILDDGRIAPRRMVRTN